MLDLACVASASAIGLPISGSQLRDGFCVRVSNSKASDCDLQITLWKVSEPRLRKKREGGSWLWPESAHCEQWFAGGRRKSNNSLTPRPTSGRSHSLQFDLRTPRHS